MREGSRRLFGFTLEKHPVTSAITSRQRILEGWPLEKTGAMSSPTPPRSSNIIPLATPFGTHHRTEIVYPSLKPRDLNFPRILDIHRPICYVAESVAIRIKPSAGPTINLSSFSRAEGKAKEEVEPRFLWANIQDHMETLCSAFGWTTLYAMKSRDEKLSHKIAIYGVSLLDNGDGTTRTNCNLYTMSPLQILPRYADASTFARWKLDLYDLIHRRSDHAHRAFSLGAPPLEDNWIPRPRQPRFDLFLSNLPSPLLHPIGSCPICLRDYNEKERKAIALKYHETHMACLECLDEWSRRHGAKPKCPHCRSPTYNVEDILHIRFQHNHRGVFQPDPKQSEYENFECACADLDEALQQSALGTNPNIPDLNISAERLSFIFDVFLMKEQLKPEILTPQRSNPALFPEIKLLREVFKKKVKEIEGTTINAIYLCALIMLAVEIKLIEQIQASGMPIRDTDGAGRPQSCSLRPDHVPFAMKMLGRSVYFAIWRKCEVGEITDNSFVIGRGKLHYNLGAELPQFAIKIEQRVVRALDNMNVDYT